MTLRASPAHSSLLFHCYHRRGPVGRLVPAVETPNYRLGVRHLSALCMWGPESLNFNNPTPQAAQVYAC